MSIDIFSIGQGGLKSPSTLSSLYSIYRENYLNPSSNLTYVIYFLYFSFSLLLIYFLDPPLAMRNTVSINDVCSNKIYDVFPKLQKAMKLSLDEEAPTVDVTNLHGIDRLHNALHNVSSHG